MFVQHVFLRQSVKPHEPVGGSMSMRGPDIGIEITWAAGTCERSRKGDVLLLLGQQLRLLFVVLYSMAVEGTYLKT